MKWISALLLVMIVAAGFAGSAWAAKETKKSDQYYPELQGDDDMRILESKRNMVSSGFQYGAWITPVFIYQETPQKTLSTSVTTFRAWLKTYLWNNSFLYVRGKDTYTKVLYQKGRQFTRDKNVADLDVGYITMASDRKDVDFSVGRKYFLLGSGLVLDGRGDGAEFNYYSKYVNIKALGTWTGWLAKDDNPYGLSDRDIATGAKRVFAGGRLSWDFFNQTLYAFGLAQFDFGDQLYNRKRWETCAIGAFYDAAARSNYTYAMMHYHQKSRYESQYYGAGLDGVIVSGLSYSGEFVMERGKSYLAGNIYPGLFGYNVKKDILAYAAQAKLNYYINVILKPVIMIHYAFGSGDVNRSNYRNPNGNAWAKDRGFMYFGTFVGGYALRPVLANLHMISGSVAFSPFSWSSIYSFKNMTISAKYMYYLKHKNMSPINSGTDANRYNKHIGQAVDLSLRWLIFSDFSFFVNYGIFMPGKASGYQYYYDTAYRMVMFTHSSVRYRHFMMGGFNVSF
ncbi:MAG: alginate export family protein [Spirochaetes bacterium]|nr:alginate export family protein [Spirochaetota bacterium]